MTQASADQIKYSDVERYRSITHPETASSVDFQALRKQNEIAHEEQRLKKLSEELSLGNFKANLAIGSRQDLPASNSQPLGDLFSGLQLGGSTDKPNGDNQNPQAQSPGAPSGTTGGPLSVLPLIVVSWL